MDSITRLGVLALDLLKQKEARYSGEATLILLALINPATQAVLRGVLGGGSLWTSIVTSFLFFIIVLARMKMVQARVSSNIITQ